MEEAREASLAQLTEAWKAAKTRLTDTQQELLSIESQIYTMVANQLPEKGTKTFDTGIKIVTGWTEQWNQGIVDSVYRNWPADWPFPFKGEWKPDGKALSYLQEHKPELYAKLSPGLTLKPKKPSFSLKGE